MAGITYSILLDENLQLFQEGADYSASDFSLDFALYPF